MEKSRFFSFKRVLFTFVFSLLAASAFAQIEVKVYHFLGGGSNTLWSNVDNWENGLKPGHDSIYTMVYISPMHMDPQNADIIMDEDVTIDYLNLDPSIFDDNHLVIQEGKTLTVNDTIVNYERDIVFEDGAQLIYPHEINVVMKKNIAAYDEDEHYIEFIASPILTPVTPSFENGLVTEPVETSFSLMYFDEGSRLWNLYSQSPFDLENGRGYAYANAYDTVLRFEGMVRGSATPVEVSLDYHANNGAVAGSNLVGNPLPCNAFTDHSHYVLNEKGTSMLAVAASEAVAIPPCRGIFVKAESEGETVAFSKANEYQTAVNQGYIELSVAKTAAQNEVVDNAIVSFNAGDNLRKVQIFDQPYLYFNNNSMDYAIISIDSVDVLPVRLKVAENGSYTLNVTQKELNLSYLHLIDNITGFNIDLLTTPEYTFTSSTNDYASRFKLVFDPHYGIEEFEAENFAYFADGQICIVDTQDFVSLQLIDMTGRVILCSDDAHTVSTTGMAPGIYLLRLNMGNRIMTQKIVIR